MNISKLLIGLILLSTLFASCSKNVKDDAKEAYELMEKSKEATLEYDLDSAHKYYQQYKEIENKYKDTPDQKAFEEAFWKYGTETK